MQRNEHLENTKLSNLLNKKALTDSDKKPINHANAAYDAIASFEAYGELYGILAHRGTCSRTAAFDFQEQLVADRVLSDP